MNILIVLLILIVVYNNTRTFNLIKKMEEDRQLREYQKELEEESDE